MNGIANDSPDDSRTTKLFGRFILSWRRDEDVCIPFDKDMVYFLTWTPTRKLRMIYGFDPQTPKPFTAARLDILGLQEKSYHEMRKDVFKGYSFDAILLPSRDAPTQSQAEKEVMADFFEMVGLNSSYRVRLLGPLEIPCCKIQYGLATMFANEHGRVIALSATPGDPVRIGLSGEIVLQQNW